MQDFFDDNVTFNAGIDVEKLLNDLDYTDFDGEAVGETAKEVENEEPANVVLRSRYEEPDVLEKAIEVIEESDATSTNLLIIVIPGVVAVAVALLVLFGICYWKKKY